MYILVQPESNSLIFKINYQIHFNNRKIICNSAKTFIIIYFIKHCIILRVQMITMVANSYFILFKISIEFTCIQLDTVNVLTSLIHKYDHSALTIIIVKT